MYQQTDYFKRKYNIGQIIHPEKSSNPAFGTTYDDFFGSDIDDADAEFVKEEFGLSEASSDGVLCCAGCFTPICYKCKINLNGRFQSDVAVNVSVVAAPTDSEITKALPPSENSMSVKRPVPASTSPEQRLVALCDECQNVVAVVDETGVYHFSRVIASCP